MLDALMGSDRNASLPSGAAYGTDQQTSGGGSHDGHHGHSGHPGPYRRKRSCYDPAVCPLYCAWGTDLHELFTNTKSDIGPNPRTCDDDAREEYLSLPSHEQERLGFEYMLYDRLRDLVRGCDRIVNRNKDKLRQEVARQQRARSGNSGSSGNVNVDDPAANISEDKVRKVAEDRARLEIIEEDIGRMVQELEGLDEKEKALNVGGGVMPKKVAEAEAAAAADDNDEGSTKAKADTTGGANEEEATDADANANTNEAQAAEVNEEKKDDGPATSEEKAENETKGKSGDKEAEPTKPETKQDSEEDTAKPTTSSSSSSLDDETKARLAEIRSNKRSILAALSSKMEQIPPLRDAIESDTRHLHYFRSNHTIDKCVCEVSGNFMSFRDADERIAAHYAGKQYVGWKMVRDKLDELRKKFGSGGPPPPRGPPPGYGPPSSRGGGGGYRDDHRRGGGGGGRRRDRSRSRERDRDRHRGGGGLRRSPDRWERDRAPRDWDRSRGGGRRDRW